MDSPRNGARNAGKCRKNWAYQRNAATTRDVVPTANKSSAAGTCRLISHAAAKAAGTKITITSVAISTPVSPRCSTCPIPVIIRSRFGTGVGVGTTRNSWAAKKLL
jgi:hypothetical protein